MRLGVADDGDAHARALDGLGRGGSSGVFNVGTGKPHSVREIIAAVSAVVGRPVQWEPAPRRPGDPAALYASSDRLQQTLGWRPQFVDIQSIVEHAWRWHAEHPRGYDDHPRG